MPILSIRTAFIEEEGKEELGIFTVNGKEKTNMRTFNKWKKGEDCIQI